MINDIANFIQYCDLKGLSKATLRVYTRNLKVFNQFCENNSCSSLDQISHSFMIDFLKDHKTSQKISIVYTLKSFGKFLAYENKINPFSRLEAPKKKRSLPCYLTEQEIERLLSIIEIPKHKAIVEILYGAGLRVNELIQIKNKDIDLSAGKIKVRGKGNKERFAIIGTCAVDAIKEYKPLNNVEESFLGFNTTQSVRRILCNYGQRLGIKITPHMLRHSAATHMLNKGANILFIKEFLGHESISTTQIYTHLNFKKLKEEHNKLEAIRKTGEVLVNVNPPVKHLHSQEEKITKIEKIIKKKVKRKKSLPCLSTFQAAEILGLSNTTVIRYVKLGKIKGSGGKGLFYHIEAEHIHELLECPPNWLKKAWVVKKGMSQREYHKQLAIEAWRMFKRDDKLPYPNANVVAAYRDRYYSNLQMAERLGVSYTFYGSHIRPRIAMMFEYEKKVKKEMMNRLVEKQMGKSFEQNNLIETGVAIDV